MTLKRLTYPARIVRSIGRAEQRYWLDTFTDDSGIKDHQQLCCICIRI